MKLPKHELLADLTNRTHELMAQAKQMAVLPEAELRKKANAQSWHALECLEHLCRYGDFYLPEIAKRLDAAQKQNASNFTSGLLGNYFAKAMLPGAKGMKTFREMNPLETGTRKNVINEFIRQQETMLSLLSRCADYDLARVKTSLSISNFIKLRLGDTLRVVIYHNQRHMVQAQKAIQSA